MERVTDTSLSGLDRLRADPLRRLGLREASDDTGVHRTSLPPLDAAGRAQANKGLRSYAAAACLHSPRSSGASSPSSSGLHSSLPS